jgi:GNAT superfamily N-acetyltransferase
LVVLIREADLTADLADVARLWLAHLTAVHAEFHARYGAPSNPQAVADRDLATIDAYRPPAGTLVLAFDGPLAVGTGGLVRLGPGTAEIRRMYVSPGHRGRGIGRAILDVLIDVAERSGYQRILLDSPEFAVAAHALYRSRGFRDVERFPESDIPDAFLPHTVFMERALR